MKIKCPFCNYKTHLDHFLDAHFQDKHSQGTIRNYYVALLFKIHEKIEEYEKDDADCRYDTLIDLKSLLENEE